MKAAVLHEFGPTLSVEEVARPVPGPDDVLIQVEACGVCHSDLHVVEGDQPALKGVTKPLLIPGHEVVGRVVERGANVKHLAQGDRVGVAWLHATCGQCGPCREGRENMCRKGLITGVMVDGGYAEYMVARASHALRVPEGLTAEAAAPLFCAGLTVYRALKSAEVGPGNRVGIFGVGGLGHLAVQIAKAWGAEVIALDVDPAKLELARSLGAAQTFNAANADDIKALRKQGGVNVAVVTSAAKAAYDTAFKCLAPGGTLSVVGLPAEPLTFPALALVGIEARIVGSSVGTRDDMRAVLELAA
ncbi:MAG TPA: zinc-dependent alcohol dehydrogenase, partial [Ramlibacter sp.]|nr:zinc-dependent alcohol dehydrogenase [Ramlibacter sp.]